MTYSKSDCSNQHAKNRVVTYSKSVATSSQSTARLESKMRSRKLFDRFKLIRAKACAAVGQPPASKVVPDKRSQIRVRVENNEMAALVRREEE